MVTTKKGPSSVEEFYSTIIILVGRWIISEQKYHDVEIFYVAPVKNHYSNHEYSTIWTNEKGPELLLKFFNPHSPSCQPRSQPMRIIPISQNTKDDARCPLSSTRKRRDILYYSGNARSLFIIIFHFYTYCNIRTIPAIIIIIT